MADHPLLLPHLASQCNSRPQLPRILRPITSGQVSHNSHGNRFVSWPTSQPLQPNNVCLHMVTTLFLVTNTISGFYIGSFSFFIRKLLCGLHQKLRNDVACNDGSIVPIVQLGGLRQTFYFTQGLSWAGHSGLVRCTCVGIPLEWSLLLNRQPFLCWVRLLYCHQSFMKRGHLLRQILQDDCGMIQNTGRSIMKRIPKKTWIQKCSLNAFLSFTYLWKWLKKTKPEL